MNKHLAIACHMALSAFLYLSPLTYLRGSGITLKLYLMYCVQPTFLIFIFYINYFYLAPKLFVAGKHRYDLLINVVLITVLGFLLHTWMEYTNSLYMPNMLHHPDALDTLAFTLRDSANLAVFAAGATALALARRWVTADQQLKTSEAARAQAELHNLRSQINPHFLLNTLNNIYALTSIDTERAQEAIMQLSRLLRHMLYDNQESFVSIRDEIQFLQNYVNLMKIRLTDAVEVIFEAQYEHSDIKVAPLLFISLIENAFKHGVSTTEPSYIHIKLTADSHIIYFRINNSNFPKTADDRSGHGIGLQQVQRRLDLAYPGRYTWDKQISENQKNYQSTITIQL